jgi:hypothetical protein
MVKSLEKVVDEFNLHHSNKSLALSCPFDLPFHLGGNKEDDSHMDTILKIVSF